MKTKDIPQDESALKNFTNEVCYAKNDADKYETAKSKGWEVKKDALDAVWNDIENQKKEALNAYRNGTKSPLLYYMLNELMDINLLSQYSGFWKITIKRHMKPKVFENLDSKKLSKYAKVFKISIEELKSPKIEGI